MEQPTNDAEGGPLARLIALCDRFEAACRAGTPPPIDDYRGEVPPAEWPDLRTRLEGLARACGGGPGPPAEATPRDGDAEPGDPTAGGDLDPTVVAADGTGTGTGAGPTWTWDEAFGPTVAPAVDGRGSGSDSGGRSATELSAGARIGDYEVVERVGKGGMGVVYRVRNHRLGRRFEALKLLARADGLDPTEGPGREAVERFRTEIAEHAALKHRYIIEVYNAGFERGWHFFTMQFIAGRTLAARIRERPLSGRPAAALMAKVAHAVAYLHGQGVIHRDLKPSNILLDSDGEPYVGDFGLVKATGEGPELTLTGMTLGTPPYMAPEQARDPRRAGERSDVYSLGATLYAAVTGRPPFQAADAVETLRQLLDEEPASPRRVNPAVSRDLETICLKCLEKDPARRYESATALADELGRVADGRPIRARPIPPWGRAWRWALRHRAIAALMLILAATFLASFLAVTTLYVRAEARGQQLEVDAYIGRIALAAAAVEANRYDRATELLAACPPRLRGWEWHLLGRLRDEPALVVADGTGSVYGVAFDPSGLRLATAGRRGAAAVWDGATGQKIADLDGIPAGVHARAVARFAGGFAVACSDGLIRAWDEDPTGRARPVRVLPSAHSKAATSLATVGAGELLVSAGDDGLVTLWASRGERRAETWGGFGPIRAVCADPATGGRVAFAGDDRVVRILDLRAKAVRALGSLNDNAHGLAFSPDGRHVAAAGADGAVTLWEADRPGARVVLGEHLDGVNAVAFSPDGRRLASAGSDGRVKLWDLAARREVLALRTPADQVESIAFSPDGARLAAGCSDGTAIVWDASDRPASSAIPAGLFAGHAAPIVALAASPDGAWVASAGDDATVRLWATTAGGRGATHHGHAEKVNALAFQPTMSVLASGGRDGTIQFWCLDEPGPAGPVLPVGSRVIALAYGPDGRALAASGSLGQIDHWDRADPATRRVLGTAPDEVYALAYDPNGRWVASAGHDGTIRLWSTAESGGAWGPPLRGHAAPVSALAVSPDGRRLASASYDHSVAIWDVAEGRLLHRLLGHGGRVWGVAISPDGTLVASSSGDRTVKLWRMDTGRPVATLRGHASRVYAVAFDPLGRFLASAGADRTVRLWDRSAWDDGRPTAEPRP